jgi:hypothetical protein
MEVYQSPISRNIENLNSSTYFEKAVEIPFISHDEVHDNKTLEYFEKIVEM